MTRFRYYADPHGSRNSSWQEEPATCALCRRERPGYGGPYAAPAPGEAYSVGVYLFRCLACERPLLLWDAD